jgi:hypothetical protein
VRGLTLRDTGLVGAVASAALSPFGDLYNEGVESVDWDGGFRQSGGSTGVGTTTAHAKEADHLRLAGGDSELAQERTWVTDLAVDLTNVGAVEFDWENEDIHSGVYTPAQTALVASTSRNEGIGVYDSRLFNSASFFARRTDTLPVSALEGLHHIRVHGRDGVSAYRPYRVKVYRATLLGMTPTPLYNNGTEHVDWVEGFTSGEGSQSKEEDHLLLSCPSTTAGGERTYVTDDTIDLTNIDYLEIDWHVNTNSTNARAVLNASTTKMSSRTGFEAQLLLNGTINTRRTDYLDVSGLTGNHYVRVHASDGASSSVVILKVYRVRAVELKR